jgi:hypothetical protein
VALKLTDDAVHSHRIQAHWCGSSRQRRLLSAQDIQLHDRNTSSALHGARCVIRETVVDASCLVMHPEGEQHCKEDESMALVYPVENHQRLHLRLVFFHNTDVPARIEWTHLYERDIYAKFLFLCSYPAMLLNVANPPSFEGKQYNRKQTKLPLQHQLSSTA